MVTLEQVQLLESKVAKVIEHVDRVTEENSQLREKLEDYQRRIDELEVLIERFKEEQNRIEDGILAALGRLNEFETAVSKSLNPRHKAPAGGHGSGGGGLARRDSVPPETGGEAGGAELNAPAEEESDEDIIFASAGEGVIPASGDEGDEDQVSLGDPADTIAPNSAELDIF